MSAKSVSIPLSFNETKNPFRNEARGRWSIMAAVGRKGAQGAGRVATGQVQYGNTAIKQFVAVIVY